MKKNTFWRSIIILLIGLAFTPANLSLASTMESRQTHTLNVVGLAPRQTLRLSMANQQQKNQPLTTARARILVKDSRGNTLTQTEEAVVPPGEARTFDFDLDNLKSPGEPGVSLDFELQFSLSEMNQAETSRTLQISAELVEQSTGKVVVLIPGTSPSDPPPCWTHCTHLFCLHYCLRPFTIYVLPTPSSN